MTSERAITKNIMGYLERKGMWVMKIHGGPYQKAGVPDILAIASGRAIWFEVKKPGGVMSEKQKKVASQLTAYGCAVYCVSSISEAMVAVEEWGNGNFASAVGRG